MIRNMAVILAVILSASALTVAMIAHHNASVAVTQSARPVPAGPNDERDERERRRGQQVGGPREFWI